MSLKEVHVGNSEMLHVFFSRNGWQFCLFLGVGRLKDRKSLEIACFSDFAGGVVMPGNAT